MLTTLLLAIGSFAVVGAYLSNQIANNLFQERLAQAESETRYNVKQVQDTFDGAQVTDQSSVITLVYDTLNAVEGRGSVIQRRYVFEAMPEQTKPRNRWVESRASDQLTIGVIPPNCARPCRTRARTSSGRPRSSRWGPKTGPASRSATR